MNSKIALLVVVCFAFVCAVTADDDKKKHKHICMGEEIKHDEELMKIMKTCGEEHKARHPDQKKDDKKHHHHDNCFTACLLTKTGSVHDGKYDVSKAKEHVNARYPEKAREPINKALQKCADDNTDTLSLDNDCKSYEKLGKCAMKAVMHTCHPNAGKGKDKDKKEGEAEEELP